jgi:YD repeat-containing protein
MADRLTSCTTPNGTVGYTYDNANRLTALSNPYSESASYTYNNGNLLTQVTHANSSSINYAYDGLNRATDV